MASAHGCILRPRKYRSRYAKSAGGRGNNDDSTGGPKAHRTVPEAGMLTWLHCCGYIVDILDDFIEIGLDVINMDQQENMGLDLLGERFGHRIAFWCPVDIQKTMCKGTLNDIRDYCQRLVQNFGGREGGFIAKWYTDPVGAGHSQEAIDAMCREFQEISRAMYGRRSGRAFHEVSGAGPV